MTGGEDHIVHRIVKDLLVMALSNGTILIRVDSNILWMILGAALILTIILDRFKAHIIEGLAVQ